MSTRQGAKSGFKGRDMGNNKVLFIFNDTMDIISYIHKREISST